MTLKELMRTRPRSELDTMAARAGTTYAYLQQLAGGHRKPSIGLVRRLIAASNGELDLQALRPDAFELPVAPATQEAA